MNEQRFPKGWDEQRVQKLLAELDTRTEEEWVAADEAAAGHKETSVHSATGGPHMAVEGTVVNGAVILDHGARLPEGARVRVELTEDEDDIAPPPEPYDREQVLAILRESIEDAKAGRVVPAREVLKQIAERHGLPLEPGE